MRPSVLLVDDEPAVLDGLVRNLRGDFELSTAVSGRAALDALRDGSFAVVVSDLRMPGMDGVTVLSYAQDLAPDSVRILLTGQADVEAASRAVNLGQIFRFLTKPISAKDLVTILRSAVRQHQLQTAERELLESTLQGAIQTLLDTLALANPLAFARATRIQRLVARILDVLEIDERWQIEVAAGLSQLGAITLPLTVAEKLHVGAPLQPGEHEFVERLPHLGEQLLKNIPRLEDIRAIIRLQDQRYDGKGPDEFGPAGQDIPFGARILKVALLADRLTAGGASLSTVRAELAADAHAYDPVLLRAIDLLLEDREQGVRAVTPAELSEGMILVKDIVDSERRLLVGAGQEISRNLIERVRNFDRTTGVVQPIYVQKSISR